MKMITIKPYQKKEQSKWMPSPIVLSDVFISKILMPYKESSRYLKSACLFDWVADSKSPDFREHQGIISIEGNFTIPENSCILGAAHFNAIEFTVCYMQLASALLGKCIQTDIFHRLAGEWHQKVNLSFDRFLKYQPSCLSMVKTESVFFKHLNSKDFTGKINVQRILLTSKTAFLFTRVSFLDVMGEKSKASVLLAFKNANGL